MSSHIRATSETTLLLGDPPPSDQSNNILWERVRFSPGTLFIPVALGIKLASMIPTTTLIEVLRQTVCRFWSLSEDGSMSPELCDTTEAVQHFSTALTIIGVTEGIIFMIVCGVLGRISSRYGRKPAFLLVIAAGITGICLIIGSHYVPDWISAWVFVLGVLIQLCTGALPCDYLISVCIVDVCDPEDRTASLSMIAGWANLGSCISLYLGGFITMKTNNPLIVFYISAGLFASTFIYIVTILPESFPEERRNALSRTHQEPTSDGLPRTSPFKSALLTFEPLKAFMPTRNVDGTSNRRLTWCAAHTFVFMAANGYATAAWLVFATSKYHLTPADTGLFLAIITVSSTIALAGIAPLLVSFLRPYYTQKNAHFAPEEEGIGNGKRLEMKTSDYLDVHLAVVSCVIIAIFFLVAAASTSNPPLTISAICIGISSIRTPAVRSLVVGSVDPLKQGEALAAIEIVSGAGVVLSPIIMGGILTATISTTPLLMFYVHLAFVLISGGILLLVRDVDRHQRVNET